MSQRAIIADFAFFERHQPLRNRSPLGKTMRRKDQRFPLLRQFPQKVFEVGGGFGIEPSERLAPASLVAAIRARDCGQENRRGRAASRAQAPSPLSSPRLGSRTTCLRAPDSPEPSDRCKGTWSAKRTRLSLCRLRDDDPSAVRPSKLHLQSAAPAKPASVTTLFCRHHWRRKSVQIRPARCAM